jgi:hypothetical protein
VVEPMMVGIIGGGMAHIRTADGSIASSTAKAPCRGGRPDTYTSKPGSRTTCSTPSAMRT